MTSADRARRLRVGEGGLLRRLEARCHLTTPFRQICAALLITWVPIVLLGFAIELTTGYFVPLLHDPAVHVRLVIATPVLLFLDRVFPSTCRDVLDQLSHFGFVRPADQARFDRCVVRATHLGDWWLPEALIAISAFAVGVGYLFGVMPWAGFGRPATLTAPAYWYALVALPLFEFLLFRLLWRWAVWVRLLVDISRIDLDLDATHPDRRGGVSVLGRPSIAYCAALLFVASAVLSAEWGARFTFVSLAHFIPLLLVFAAVATLVAFGPLMLFSLQIHRARRDAQLEVGGLAARAGRAFRQRWNYRPGSEVIASAGHPEPGGAVHDLLRHAQGDPRDAVQAGGPLHRPARHADSGRAADADQIPHTEWLAMATLFFKGGLSAPVSLSGRRAA